MKNIIKVIENNGKVGAKQQSTVATKSILTQD